MYHHKFSAALLIRKCYSNLNIIKIKFGPVVKVSLCRTLRVAFFFSSQMTVCSFFRIEYYGVSSDADSPSKIEQITGFKGRR